MQFGLTESQLILKNNARKFFPAECPSAEVRRLMETETAFDETLWRKIAEQGFTGMIFPEEYGGLGLGMVEMAAALEEMGRALIPGPFHSTVLLAGSVINEAGSDAQKQKYLAPIAAGDARATLALLEGSGDWDTDSIHLRARPSASGGYTLSGEKFFVPDLGAADFFVVAARAGADLTLCVVDAKATGLRATPMAGLDTTRKLYALILDNVEVAKEDILATGEEAKRALDRGIAIATVGLIAEMVGGMQKVQELAIEYAKTRKQFGQPIGKFQAVQQMCADMYLYTESSRSAVYYAAWALQENTPDAPSAVSVAKAYASDACREVGNKGVQVHGGMGFTWENDVHLYYRRAKASEIAFGDANFHREKLARLVIDRPAARIAEI